ncbi:hypothetical protein M2160_004267 [Streptomyces sp. SAI-117]|uniref:hypothetical protein n=1 Tax=unclassified Streptomyces TaxID=2593676 RepID=UPI0024748D66|nr:MULTISPECIES: hypothetical protein [unclassified Streptomyces]MDH6550212.1 hypothetical protein [Streptomyces sp. SAI-041]MDH6569246.1 hypothetical protein [Streptomyces sp. SAI-117]
MNQLPSSPQVKPSPENDLAAVLTAWDEAHPAPTDPDWRHLLDELAHPRTTQAFHSLATSTA